MLNKHVVAQVIQSNFKDTHFEILNPLSRHICTMEFDPLGISTTIRSNGQIKINFVDCIKLEGDGYSAQLESVTIHTYAKDMTEKKFIAHLLKEVQGKVFNFPSIKFSTKGPTYGCSCFDRKNEDKTTTDFLYFMHFLLKYHGYAGSPTLNEDVEHLVGMAMEYLRGDIVIGTQISSHIREELGKMVEDTILKDYPDLAYTNDDTLYLRINYEMAPFVIEKINGIYKRVRKESSARVKLLTELLK